MEKCRILALGIFILVLYPSTTRIISLEAANLFVEYENTKINPSATILAEAILFLNHYIRLRKVLCDVVSYCYLFRW
jgi:hypothetical protein